MYEERFGTGWESLSWEGALDRAYALGVAEVAGDPPAGEFDRILGLAQSKYSETVLEVAHEQGRRAAAEARRSPGETDAETFRTLIERGPDLPGREDGDGAEGADEGREGLPEGMPERVGAPPLLENDEDDLGRVRLPNLLRRGED